jgi:hypothetical protein
MERLATWWHPYDPERASKGDTPYFKTKVGFCYSLGILFDILPDISGFWSFLEPKFWEEVGDG